MNGYIHTIRQGSSGFQVSSTVEVIGNGPGMENTVYCGEYNALSLWIDWAKGSTVTEPTMRFYWSPEGELFFQKCFVSESNGFTLATDAQVVTFPPVSFSYGIEIPAHAPFFRLGITLKDADALTASLNVWALPRMR